MNAGYNRISIKKDLGLHYNVLKNVAIPEKVMEISENKMKNYERNIKKYSHAKVKGKIMSALAEVNSEAKNSQTYKDEIKRRDQIKKTFLPVYKYLCEVEEYFEGCKNLKIIKKYNKKIQNDRNHLSKKGYFNIYSVNEKEFEHFDKSKYDLSFVSNIPLPRSQVLKNESPPIVKILPPIPTKINAVSETDNYKPRCLKSFTNIRVVFSAYLSLINDVYKKQYSRIPKMAEGTKQVFENFRNKLDSVMPKYEKCVVDIVKEMEKHDFYFKHIVGKNRMASLKRYVEENRRQLQSRISKIKGIILRIEFMPITGGNDYEKYKSLIDELRSLNTTINNLEISISEGKYENFESNYQVILHQFKNIPGLVKEFQNATYESNKDYSNELDKYEDMVDQHMQIINKALSAMDSYRNKFREQYENFLTSLAKAGAKLAFSIGLSGPSLLTDPAEPLKKTLEALVETFDEIEKNLEPIYKRDI